MTRTDARNERDEAGAVAPMLVILVVSIIALSGLTFDGGRILAGRREAQDAATQAALAATSAIDITAVRQGASSLDPATAVSAAESYLAVNGYSGTATVQAGQIVVTVSLTVDMSILSSVGIGPKTVTGVASARLVRGVFDAET